YGLNVTETLTVGEVGSGSEVTADFSVTSTLDIFPDALVYTPTTNVDLGMQSCSTDTLVISNLGVASVPITVSGGAYRLNGGAPTSAADVVTNGDTLDLCANAANSF